MLYNLESFCKIKDFMLPTYKCFIPQKIIMSKIYSNLEVRILGTQQFAYESDCLISFDKLANSGSDPKLFFRKQKSSFNLLKSLDLVNASINFHFSCIFILYGTYCTIYQFSLISINHLENLNLPLPSVGVPLDHSPDIPMTNSSLLYVCQTECFIFS